ncbi:hypothetical protein CISIN_1g031024mg [Citrus sinensis]|uniref:Uncharacterized protein n=1 Tax=Citrus sinensis TaxID=2711 RepID=A0A067EQW4_CITSI|nr:hypothetical protein CISIN_1g031024mg [Citrus sinensis]
MWHVRENKLISREQCLSLHRYKRITPLADEAWPMSRTENTTKVKLVTSFSSGTKRKTRLTHLAVVVSKHKPSHAITKLSKQNQAKADRTIKISVHENPFSDNKTKQFMYFRNPTYFFFPLFFAFLINGYFLNSLRSLMALMALLTPHKTPCSFVFHFVQILHMLKQL